MKTKVNFLSYYRSLWVRPAIKDIKSVLLYALMMLLAMVSIMIIDGDWVVYYDSNFSYMISIICLLSPFILLVNKRTTPNIYALLPLSNKRSVVYELLTLIFNIFFYALIFTVVWFVFLGVISLFNMSMHVWFFGSFAFFAVMFARNVSGMFLLGTSYTIFLVLLWILLLSASTIFVYANKKVYRYMSMAIVPITLIAVNFLAMIIYNIDIKNIVEYYNKINDIPHLIEEGWIYYNVANFMRASPYSIIVLIFMAITTIIFLALALYLVIKKDKHKNY